MLYRAFSLFYQVFYWILLLRILSSFMPTGQDSPPVRFVHSVTEPFLAPIRNAFGLVNIGGMYLDVSPIVLLLILNIINRLLWSIL